MYQEYFELSHKPFSLTPDPAFLYLSETHREALGHLLYGLRNRTGFIAVVGEVGTGKTTLLRTLLGQLSESDYRTALIFNPRVSPIELLRSIMREFDLESSESGRTAMLDQLNSFLLAEHAAGRTVVLVIDEAQNLGEAALEEVRLLSNLETETDKLLQIVLVGQPELAATLAGRKLRQLRQRIAVFYSLRPLSTAECLAYARHRIEVAGGVAGKLFSRVALHRACRVSGGIPRRLNLLLDRALLIAYAEDQKTVHVRHLRRAYRELNSPFPRARRGMFKYAIVGSLMVLLSATSAWQWLDRVSVADPPDAVPPVIAPQETLPVHPMTRALAEMPAERSRYEALSRLFERWGEAPLAQNTVAPLEQAVASRGLSLYRFTGSLDELLSLNTPAVLTVRLPGTVAPRFLALTGLSGDRFLVASRPDDTDALSYAQLSSFWAGDAWLLWRNSAALPMLTRSGARGRPVLEIQKRLLGAGCYSGALTGEFDDETLSAVRTFQRTSGLPVDGAVGPLTLMRLYQAGGLDSPVLLRLPGGQYEHNS